MLDNPNVGLMLFFKTRHDYINASKVNGGEPMGRQWIVAQGPLNSTVEVN